MGFGWTPAWIQIMPVEWICNEMQIKGLVCSQALITDGMRTGGKKIQRQLIKENQKMILSSQVNIWNTMDKITDYCQP